jgi:hemerythrin-like metal-binding protein
MAHIFQWDPSKLSIHVDKMDQEHIKLINLMNKLSTRYEEKAPFTELVSIAKELQNWTITHFDHEEKFFDTLPYAHANVHKKIHKDLLAKLDEHVKNFEKTKTLTDEFFRFLKVWLTAHIAGIDMKYGEIANKKAA